jgi:hypothetical protein
LPEPTLLDSSTTDTNFLYFGSKPPSETMRMVGEVASAHDRQWFLEHPEASYRVRWSLPGEFPVEGLETLAGAPSLKSGRWVVVVLQLRPGARQRIETLFVDSARTASPIPEEVWPSFYEVATAEDREKAARELAKRFRDGSG